MLDIKLAGACHPQECHKAKNLIPVKGVATQTGRAVLQLQQHLPLAKVLYSSATGASVPSNMAYMVRLGSFGFDSLPDMLMRLDQCADSAYHTLAPG